MTIGQSARQMDAVLLLVGVGVLMMGSGCAGKQVASTSGDQTTTLKGKGDALAEPVENVKQEPLLFVEPPEPGDEPAPQDRVASPPDLENPSEPESGAVPDDSLIPPSRSALVEAEEPAALEDIYFDFDQYSIRGDARGVLDGHARWLHSQADKSLVIEGHCDERGTQDYNLVLGDKRARSVKRYLEDLGIPASRLQTTSYGEVRPVCHDHNEACWSKNRRAHFVVE